MIEIIAHRGSREGAAEHTLTAYRKAIAAGADTLECDVRLSADGQLVCLHDRRVDFVSDGRGVVSAMTLADLRRLKFGNRRQWRALDRHRRPAPTAPGRLEADLADIGVLTLRQLLELVAETPRPLGLAVETKHPTRYRGLVEERLTELLREFELLESERVRVMSFSSSSLRRMRRLAPVPQRVLLMGRVPPHLRDGRLPDGLRAAGVDLRVIRRDPGYIARAHDRGNAVYAWTVNSFPDADLCLAAGVDALITDRPGALRAHLTAAHAAGSA